jgi:hypothetical protein
MSRRADRANLGSARISHVRESVALSRTFWSAPLRASGNRTERPFRRDAETNMRDACAPQT